MFFLNYSKPDIIDLIQNNKKLISGAMSSSRRIFSQCFQHYLLVWSRGSVVSANIPFSPTWWYLFLEIKTNGRTGSQQPVYRKCLFGIFLISAVSTDYELDLRSVMNRYPLNVSASYLFCHVFPVDWLTFVSVILILAGRLEILHELYLLIEMTLIIPIRFIFFLKYMIHILFYLMGFSVTICY